MPRRNLLILLLASLISLACYARAARNRYADTFAQAMNIVTRDYVDEVEPRVLFEGAMDGMMDQLDMYSGYTPPREYLQFKQQIGGEFPGIGVMIDPSNKSTPLTVLVPLPGSPAAKAGILPGDVIEAINGEKTADLPREQALKKIKGPAGSPVHLTIRRATRPEPLELEVVRATIAIESVHGDARRGDGAWIFHLLDHPRMGYIRIDTFGERTADDLRQAFDSFRQPEQEIDGLIIDLRGNEGGLLKAAIETCDMLLDGGLIVSTRGRKGAEKASHSATSGTEVPLDLPLVVLVDRYSASASEIVSACLQDHHRAAIVGERTWGKGTVQNIEDLEGGKSAIRLTIATYWRPSGKDIHKRRNAKDTDNWGVRPDAGLDIALSKEQYEQRVLARRKRDVTPLEQLTAARPAAAPAPTPASSVPDAPPIPVPAASEDAQIDPHFVDPQLQRAIDHLQQLIKVRSSKPRVSRRAAASFGVTS